LEAVAAVHELSFAVNGIAVSDMLPRTPDLIFVNVTTLEGQAYCLELTSKGWRVTSLRHDCMNGDIKRIELHTRYFETVYALMDQVSPGYRQKFSDALATKLQALQQRESTPTQFSIGGAPLPHHHHPHPNDPPLLDDPATLGGLSLGDLSLENIGIAVPRQPTSDPRNLGAPSPVISVRHPSGEGKTQQFPSSPGGLA
jgi:hypothetical protein